MTTEKKKRAYQRRWVRAKRARCGRKIDDDPTERIRAACGNTVVIDVKKAFNFFETPVDLAGKMAAMAMPFKPGEWSVLEPSAGGGRLARACRDLGAKVSCVETQDKLARELNEAGFYCLAADFLTVNVDYFLPFDAVVMNPPFEGGQECEHVMHALKFVKPGGRLVSVMSNAVTFRKDKPYRAFRELVTCMGKRAKINELPDGTFKESGTDVRAVIVTLDVPGKAGT